MPMLAWDCLGFQKCSALIIRERERERERASGHPNVLMLVCAKKMVRVQIGGAVTVVVNNQRYD